MSSIQITSACQGQHGKKEDNTIPVYKCVLVGMLGAGKTTFYARFKEGHYYDPPDDSSDNGTVHEDGICECKRRFEFAGNIGNVSNSHSIYGYGDFENISYINPY